MKKLMVFILMMGGVAYGATDIRQPVCIVDSWGDDTCSTDDARTYVDGSTVTTVSTTLYTVTSGKTLYVDSISVSVINSNVSVNGILNIRDGSTSKVSVLTPQAGVGALASLTQGTINTITYPTPRRFSTNFNIQVQAGTLNASISFSGYER